MKFRDRFVHLLQQLFRLGCHREIGVASIFGAPFTLNEPQSVVRINYLQVRRKRHFGRMFVVESHK